MDVHCLYSRGKIVLHALSLHRKIEHITVGTELIVEVQMTTSIHGQAHGHRTVGHIFRYEIKFLCADILRFAIECETQCSVFSVKEHKRLMVLPVVFLQFGRLHPSALCGQFQFDQLVLQGDDGLLPLVSIKEQRRGILRCGLLLGQLLLFQLLGFLLIHQSLNRILEMLHLRLFFSARTIEHAKSYQHCTNQDKPDKRIFLHSFLYLIYYLSIAALINDMNKGCGFNTVLLYSGWNCVPIYHFSPGISMISTKSDSGLTPTQRMPAFSNSAL